MGLLQEFKTFATKGNAMDLAVGIILGTAFTKIVNSLVADMIMPPIGLLIGGVDFKNLVVTLKQAVLDTEGKIIAEAVNIRYGLFVNNCIDFLIVAFSVFMIVRTLNKIISQREALTAFLIKKKVEEAEAEVKLAEAKKA